MQPYTSTNFEVITCSIASAPFKYQFWEKNGKSVAEILQLHFETISRSVMSHPVY